MEVQAQNDELQLNALKDATLTSSAGKITIAAKEEILITCKGAYIKLANGEVEIGSPKLVRVKAPMEVSGVKGINYPLQNIPPLQVFSNKLDLYDVFGPSNVQIPFTIMGNKDRESQHGILDKMGRTSRIYSDKAETVKIFAGNATLLPGKESEENK